MCIIVVQPKNVLITEDIIKNCWDNNNDGAGIMFAHNGEIQVFKELHSFKKLMQYKRKADVLNVNIIIHFRIGTSGGINIQNCHPFKVNKDLYFCHNGILDINVPNDSKINDTQIYNNGILKLLPYGFEKNDGIVNLIQYSIGNKNKFVFLNSKGEFNILNESCGEWNDGAWFSNTTYKKSYSYSFKFEDDDKWMPDEYYECDSCGCRHKANELSYNDEFEMALCVSCNDEYFKYELNK